MRVTFANFQTLIRRRTHRQGILLVVVFGIFSTATDARRNSTPTNDGAVDFGPQIIYLNDGCVALDGTLTSGDFFENLTRTDAGSQSEFQKSGSIVTEYPESVTTSIRIVGGACAATLSRPPASVFHDGSFTLKFQVEWKDGMQLRPAVLSPVVAHCVGFSSVPIPTQDFNIPSITCQIVVDGHGIPLTNHLIVSVFTPDGKLFARLSARP